MVYSGVISNGSVMLDGNPVLPEGAAVRVEVLNGLAAPVESDPIYRVGELAVPTGVPDLARNVDHYLYGHPRTAIENR